MQSQLIPMVIDSDERTEHAFDIYSRLLKEHIMFLGTEIGNEIANLITTQLLFLEAEDPKKNINLYINSPDDSAYAEMAIYDTMQYVKPDVRTICMNMNISTAAMILTDSTAGKHSALPNSKIIIHQNSTSFRGTPMDIEIQAHEMLAITRRMTEIIAKHSTRSIDQMMKDIDRDRFITPKKAVEYELINEIIEPQTAIIATSSRNGSNP